MSALLLVVRERLRSDGYGKDLLYVEGDWCDGMKRLSYLHPAFLFVRAHWHRSRNVQ